MEERTANGAPCGRFGAYRLIAHRGGVVEGRHPENSAAAVAGAIERGYAMVEIDVRLTADDQIVCFHDDRVRRGFLRWVPAGRLTLAQLRRRVGGWILTLEQMVELCEGRIGVMVDTKRSTLSRRRTARGAGKRAHGTRTPGRAGPSAGTPEAEAALEHGSATSPNDSGDGAGTAGSIEPPDTGGTDAAAAEHQAFADTANRSEQSREAELHYRMEELLEGLLPDAYFIGTSESKDYFSGYAFTAVSYREIAAGKRSLESIGTMEFIFGHGNEIDAKLARAALSRGTKVVPSINRFHYSLRRNTMQPAEADIRRLAVAGCTEFQIDSEYDRFVADLAWEAR